LITLAQGLAGLSVPSKTYGIMAAGRPILFVGDESSEIAHIITESGCGDSVQSGQSEKLAGMISEWSEDTAKLSEFGGRARKLFAARFDRSHAVSAYIRTLEKCLSPSDASNAQYDGPAIAASERSGSPQV